MMAMQLPALRCSPCGRRHRHLLANNTTLRPNVVSLRTLVVHASSSSPPPPTDKETKDTTQDTPNSKKDTLPRMSPMLGMGGGGNNEPPEDKPRAQRANDLLLATLTIAGGAVGSVALLLGIALNVDPFGNLHWDARDALIGLACVIPSLVADAIIMVPDYSAPKYKKTIRLAKYSPAERRRMRAAAGSSKPLGLAGSGLQDNGRTTSSDPVQGGDAQGSTAMDNIKAALESETPVELDLLSAIAAEAEAQRAAARSGSTAPPSVAIKSRMETDASQQTVELANDTAAADASVSASTSTTADVGGTSTAATGDAASTSAPSGEEMPDEELYIEREITLRKPQPPLASALHRVQQSNIFENPGRGLSPAGEAVAIVTSHFTEEMLKRAVLLTALTSWLMDRMYEADVVDLDNMVHLPNGITMLPHDLAAWGVVAGGSVAVVLLTLRKMLARPDFGFVVAPGQEGGEAQPLTTSERARASLLDRLRSMTTTPNRQQEDEDASSKASSSASSSSSSDGASELKNALLAVADDDDVIINGNETNPKKKKKKFKQQLRSKAEKVLDDVRQRSVYSTGIEGGRRLLEWVGLSTAFVLTGNLVAPLVGSIVTDAVFSLYQRTKLKVCWRKGWGDRGDVVHTNTLVYSKTQKAMEAQAKQMTEMLTLFREINSRGSGNN